MIFCRTEYERMRSKFPFTFGEEGRSNIVRGSDSLVRARDRSVISDYEVPGPLHGKVGAMPKPF